MEADIRFIETITDYSTTIPILQKIEVKDSDTARVIFRLMKMMRNLECEIMELKGIDTSVTKKLRME